MKYWNYDNLADSYDETRKVPSELSSFFRKEIHDFLGSQFNPPYSILSIGLGTGRIESILSSGKHQLYGVDIAGEMLKQLYDKNINPPCYLIQADGFSLPFARPFQAILLIQVVHLINRNEEFLRELRKYSDTIIVGSAYTETHNHPIYKEFFNILLENSKDDLQEDEPKSLRFDEVMKQLDIDSTNRRYQIDSSVLNMHVYNGILKRSFRSMWEVEKEIFEKSVNQIDQFIKKESINLHEEFKTKSVVNLTFYDLT